MTPQQLRQIIDADATAFALMQARHDQACADRCVEIIAPTINSVYLTELSIVALYPNPADAEAIMEIIEQVSQTNPIVKRVAAWTKPGAPGINFGDARIRAMLTTAPEEGGLGLTAEQASPLLKAAEQSVIVTALDVSNARGI